MESLTRWTWIWASSRSWWWTGRPGVLQSMGLQRVRHDWATEPNWTEGTSEKGQAKSGSPEAGNWILRVSLGHPEGLWEIVKDREAWCGIVHGVTKNQTWLSDWKQQQRQQSPPVMELQRNPLRETRPAGGRGAEQAQAFTSPSRPASASVSFWWNSACEVANVTPKQARLPRWGAPLGWGFLPQKLGETWILTFHESSETLRRWLFLSGWHDFSSL